MVLLDGLTSLKDGPENIDELSALSVKGRPTPAIAVVPGVVQASDCGSNRLLVLVSSLLLGLYR